MILCDGHVHFHHGEKLSKLLDIAQRNFAAAAKQKTFTGVLWLTESLGVDRFGELCQLPSKRDRGPIERRDGRWIIESSRDGISLEAHNDNVKLIVIAGRQVVTAEDLEILALGTRTRFADGETFVNTLQRVRQDGALPVIPWGFGKWLGKRGKIVEQVITHSEDIFIGDNGGRLAGMPEPRLFRLARKKRIPILPGTDPLPLPDECQRVGSYGWIQDDVISGDQTGESLKADLCQRRTLNSFFGNLQPMGKFLRNQIKIQLQKRL